MMSENMPSYAGFCKKCGALCFAVVDDPGHQADVNNDLREMVDLNLRIERRDVGFVREHFATCTCPKSGQPRLEGLAAREAAE